MRKITTSPDGRAALLRALDHSGLSMAEFCRRRDLPYATVAAWRSEARRDAGRFVEVEAAVPVPRGGRPGRALCAEVVLPGGAVLRVYDLGGEGGAP